MADQANDILLDAVTKRFDGRAAVNAISLTIPKGKITALLGESGSGKSTLLRMISGLERVDAGRIRLGAITLSDAGTHVSPEERRIGLVFQDFALFPHMTVGENVAFGMTGMERGQRAQIARRWLSEVELENRFDAFPHELSGGEQQRVALARALAPQPRAVLLDEPFSGLDPSLREALRERMLAAIATLGTTAVFVTHDAEEAMLVADRIAILKEGALVQDGPPREVYDAPRSATAAAALGPVNRFAATAVAGVLETPFGALAAAAVTGPAEAVVRVEAIGFASEGRTVRIVERRPQGAQDLVRITAGGFIWRMLAAPGVGPHAGAEATIAIARRGAHVFPA